MTSKIYLEDQFQTPPKLARLLVNLLSKFTNKQDTSCVIDPFAGLGNILHEADVLGYETSAVEIDPFFTDTLQVAHSGPTAITNALKLTCDDSRAAFVTNPPFSNANVLLHYLLLQKEWRIFISLLPLSYLSSNGRERFWRECRPFYVYVLPKRVQFLTVYGLLSDETGKQDLMIVVWLRDMAGRETQLRWLDARDY